MRRDDKSECNSKFTIRSKFTTRSIFSTGGSFGYLGSEMHALLQWKAAVMKFCSHAECYLGEGFQAVSHSNGELWFAVVCVKRAVGAKQVI